MKKAFPGYYSPSKQDFSTLWNDCVFIFDANVLLNLYRYTASTANELIAILRKLSTRIWVPYQAALEYQKDRLNVISQQSEAYEKIQEWLEDVQKKLENQLRTYGKHPLIDVEKMIKKMSPLFNSLKKELNKSKQEHPDLIHSDELRDTITSLFDGKVGSPYSEDQLEQIYKRGEKRYRQSIPPGFSDAKKEGLEKYGDLVLWLQIIDKTKKIKKPIIFVTDDRKEDWWYKFKGETIGPHPKLVEEIKSEADVLFYMYHTEPFMKHVQDYLKQKVEQKAIEEVREVQRSLEERDAYTEVNKALGQMINELDSRRDVWAASRPLSDFVNVTRPLSDYANLTGKLSDLATLATSRPLTDFENLNRKLTDFATLATSRPLSDFANLNRKLTDLATLAASRPLSDFANLNRKLTDLATLAASRPLSDFANLNRKLTDLATLAASRPLSDFANLNRKLTDLATARDSLPTKQEEIIQKGGTKKSDSEPKEGQDE
jgi:hypothetical protein